MFSCVAIATTLWNQEIKSHEEVENLEMISLWIKSLSNEFRTNCKGDVHLLTGRI